MREPFWWQCAGPIVVVLAAIGNRSATGQDPSTPAPQLRQTLNIDFIFVMHICGQPGTWSNAARNLPTVYKEVMVDEIGKWYPIGEKKTRVAIVGYKAIGGQKTVFATLLEWSTDIAEWETRLTAIDKDILQDDRTIDGALKVVQNLVSLGRDSGRPTVVLFSALTFNLLILRIENYGFDRAVVLVNSLKADGVLLLVAMDVYQNEYHEAVIVKMIETFGTEFVYQMPLDTWKEKFKGLPAWIESRVTSTFCNETNRGDTCFYNARHECKHGKYHPKLPLTVGDCEASDYSRLPELPGTCANVSCEETCDSLWPWDVSCSGRTCGDKAPKRQGPMKWNQLAYCSATKICPECPVTTTVPTGAPPTAPVTSAITPGATSGGGITEGEVVQQLIVTVVISAWLMIPG